ncbi:MAG: hypothetical protein AAFR11_10635 [Pseudomonadota bacterium]
MGAIALEAFDQSAVYERRRSEALTVAERRGYEIGYADAEAAAQEARLADMTAAEAAAHAVAEAAGAFAAARATHADAAACVAADIIRLALPFLARRGLAAEIGDIVRAAVKSGPARIVVETSDDLAARLGVELQAIEGVSVDAAPRFSGAQASVRWERGGADIDFDALAAALDRVIGADQTEERTEA